LCDHRREELERSVGRLAIAGRHEVEQQPPDHRQTEASHRRPLVVRAQVGPRRNRGERLVDQRWHQSIEWRLALGAARGNPAGTLDPISWTV
jgi:hypothetical protein